MEWNVKIPQMTCQQEEKVLSQACHTEITYTLKTLCGGGKICMLICKNDKIVLPTMRKKHAVQWYPDVMCQPGIRNSESTK